MSDRSAEDVAVVRCEDCGNIGFVANGYRGPVAAVGQYDRTGGKYNLPPDESHIFEHGDVTDDDDDPWFLSVVCSDCESYDLTAVRRGATKENQEWIEQQRAFGPITVGP